MSLCPLTPFSPCTGDHSEACFQACVAEGKRRINRVVLDSDPEAFDPNLCEHGVEFIQCTQPHRPGGLAGELTRWWLEDSAALAAATVEKMAEYGSGDLVQLGQHLRRLAGRPIYADLDRAMQLGCLMYLIGKLERAVEACSEDRDVKDDTWLDIEVYAKMARANRAGVWKVPAGLRGES